MSLQAFTGGMQTAIVSAMPSASSLAGPQDRQRAAVAAAGRSLRSETTARQASFYAPSPKKGTLAAKKTVGNRLNVFAVGLKARRNFESAAAKLHSGVSLAAGTDDDYDEGGEGEEDQTTAAEIEAEAEAARLDELKAEHDKASVTIGMTAAMALHRKDEAKLGRGADGAPSLMLSLANGGLKGLKVEGDATGEILGMLERKEMIAVIESVRIDNLTALMADGINIAVDGAPATLSVSVDASTMHSSDGIVGDLEPMVQETPLASLSLLRELAPFLANPSLDGMTRHVVKDEGSAAPLHVVRLDGDFKNVHAIMYDQAMIDEGCYDECLVPHEASEDIGVMTDAQVEAAKKYLAAFKAETPLFDPKTFALRISPEPIATAVGGAPLASFFASAPPGMPATRITGRVEVGVCLIRVDAPPSEQ